MARPTPRELGKLPTNDEMRLLIVEDRPKELVEWAEKVGEHLAACKLTTNQIRNVFGTVRQIEMNWRSDPDASYRQAVLLMPKLGYAAARERGKGMGDLETVLLPGLTAIKDTTNPAQRSERFMRFAEFFEAILAYHRKYGGN